MPATRNDASEGAFLSRILEPGKAILSEDAARAILGFDFAQVDKDRMRALSAKAREGTLSCEEQIEINNYERVGHLINILQSKARRSLKAGIGTNGK